MILLNRKKGYVAAALISLVAAVLIFIMGGAIVAKAASGIFSGTLFWLIMAAFVIFYIWRTAK
jgi:hypothetical protein